MIKAIVYTSNTGTTKEYARLLSETITLPYYSLDEAEEMLDMMLHGANKVSMDNLKDVLDWYKE